MYMKGLNRTQLKIIAIAAMVCDHFAWGFCDFMSPIGQILHIVGRFTIPVMCFFVAEGFRKTSNIKKYISRMISFWIIAIIPFYLFFHEEYDYRQNIIFDLLLGLLLLVVLESKELKKWHKVILATVLFFVSAFVGGWPIMPMLYMLVFYYVKEFKKQTAWVCVLTVCLVLFLGVAIELNNIWHFSKYDWHWYEKLYFLGFMLPLLVLKKYNGKKGSNVGGKYFFYAFYPAHFLFLYGIKELVAGVGFAEIYVLIHIVALALEFLVVVLVKIQKPSHAQSGFLIFAMAAIMYTFGFLVEITSGSVAGVYAAIKIEYIGECLVVIGFTWFMKEFWKKDIPKFVFVIEIFVTCITMWSIFTVESNHIFYKNMTMDFSGSLPKIVLEYGMGFYLFLTYLAIVCGIAMGMALSSYKKSKGVEKKRMQMMFLAPICLWLPFLVKAVGLTGGYEIPSVGIVAVVALMGNAVIRYGYFDSLTVAGENALNHGKEGMLVIDLDYKVIYCNKSIKKMFGDIMLNMNIREHNILKDVFNGELKSMQLENEIYELRVDTLTEGKYVVGYMLWVLNITEYQNKINQISEKSRKDSLTGAINRGYYEVLVESFLSENGEGTMLMLDLDNFKTVNDTFGHQTGDEVLVDFAAAMKKVVGEKGFLCRIGGDEFSIFIKHMVQKDDAKNFAIDIIESFKRQIEEKEYGKIVTTSIGIAMKNKEDKIGYVELYNRADKALYLSKNNGKNIYKFY